MKLVTFNIRCDFGQDGKNNFSCRKQRIKDKIAKEQPDIICFQEVLPHVAVWLKENLNDYYVVGCGRDVNLEDEQVSIAYKKVKYNLMELETFWLSETPTVPGSRYKDQSECPRVCTDALFQDMETKKIFRIFNTHLDHVGIEARVLGLKQILKKMEEDASADKVPAVLAGDFNAEPDWQEIKMLKQYPQYIDLTSEITGTFHDFGRQEKADKIDYIIAQDSFQCISAVTWEDCWDGVYLSDHYPVCVEII
ncbi:MAG TPA: endonuclease [Lachnospiraceae bacterium]|jgi:endonuclease/exonuclease/phosphatase family metal-dependent hydrolase|nr:endonuclease [Lachnospiraceae bacterium]HBY71726.1 endonuclease [Lachnospiraceae bacterium]HCR39710.1 endonuclease [Lachnospiraceae bacterium]